MQYACGRCAPCKAGAEMLCAAQRSTGVTVNGGYATFVSAPEAFVHKIPDGLDLVEAAPLLCAGITVFAPLRRAGNWPGRPSRWPASGAWGTSASGWRRRWAPTWSPSSGDRGRRSLPLARSPGSHRLGEGEDRRALTKMGGADVILLTGSPPGSSSSASPGWAERDAGDPGGDRGERLGPPGGIIAGQKRIEGSLIGTRGDMDAMLRFAADHGIRSMVERHPLSARQRSAREIAGRQGPPARGAHPE